MRKYNTPRKGSKTAMRRYYGLITFEDGQFTWTFGSYDRSDVVSEREDMHDHGIRLKDMTVMSFLHCPSDAEIEKLLDNMNANMID